jgi:predicted acyl esterase
VPYEGDFANINIPVLTFEGYYDDGQISGLHYMLEDLKYNPRAIHYLIIGPYDHFGTQSGGVPVLRDYKVDPIALISTRDITFQWLDYILKGAKKPKILKDKINYELMGANVWKHAPSIAKMAIRTLKLYLTDAKNGNDYDLTQSKPVKPGVLDETVDFADRNTSYGDYYPYPIIKDSLDRSNGLFFISKPFNKPVAVNGMFSGILKAVINKKDMDICLALYGVMPSGKYFELSYFIGRASYAKDMSKRVLLHTGRHESIPFSRTRLVSRQMSKGSRLLVVLNVLKNSFSEINYGTGKPVADETIKDAKTPLKIKWFNDSFIKVPVAE